MGSEAARALERLGVLHDSTSLCDLLQRGVLPQPELPQELEPLSQQRYDVFTTHHAKPRQGIAGLNKHTDEHFYAADSPKSGPSTGSLQADAFYAQKSEPTSPHSPRRPGSRSKSTRRASDDSEFSHKGSINSTGTAKLKKTQSSHQLGDNTAKLKKTQSGHQLVHHNKIYHNLEFWMVW